MVALPLQHRPGIDRVVSTPSVSRSAPGEEGMEALESVLGSAEDLGRRLPPTHPLAETVNGFLQSLEESMTGVLRQTVLISESAFGLDDRLEGLVEEMVVSDRKTAEINEAVGHLSGEIRSLSRGGDRVSASIRDLSAEAAQGGEAARIFFDDFQKVAGETRQVHRFIRDFQVTADSIGSMVELVGQILQQLRILSINASIEAAREGDRGLGFAVVAQEMRRLSDRSGDSMRQVKEIVDRLRSDTGRIVSGADQTMGLLNPMSQRQEELNDRLQRILSEVQQVEPTLLAFTTALENQAAAVGQISEAVRELAEGSGRAERRVAGGKEAAATLHRTVEGLLGSVGRFRLTWHDRLLGILAGIAADPGLLAAGEQATRTLEQAIRQTPFFELLYLMDRYGVQRTPNVVHPARQGVIQATAQGADRSDRAYFRETLRSDRGDYASPLYLSSATQELCQTLAVVLRDGYGMPRGVLAADINVPTLLALEGQEGEGAEDARVSGDRTL